MKLTVVAVMLIALPSCVADPVPQDATPRNVKKNAPAVPAKVRKKPFAGRVTFVGLTLEQLSKIRVIPEAGKKMSQPVNQTYDQVDGLWMKGAGSNEWLKIPDHSEVWVGKEPKEFDGTAHLGNLKIYYRSSPVLQVFGAMKGGLKRPGWVPNSGKTRSPVPSPWKSER